MRTLVACAHDRHWTDDGALPMMKFTTLIGSFAALCMIQLGVAGAASLSGINGEVLVDKGQGPKVVTGGANLKSGDLVIVQKGSATLTYSDGCQIHVDPGSSTTVSEKSPCAAQASNTPATQPSPQGSPAPAGGYAGAGLGAGGIGLSTAALAVGAIAVIAVGASTAAKNDKDKPSSP
jgi:hypothetical protein